MRRREFITLLGGAAAWPVAAGAQQLVPVRRMGLLMPFPHGHPVGEARLATFLDGLEHSGWTDGQNVRIDIRWAGGNANDIRRHAGELAAAMPDVIIAFNSSAVAATRQATRTIPIVFTLVADPVGAGYVGSLARPGGNITGFLALEYAMSGKWLELLKEIVPRVTRVAVLRDSDIAGGPGQFGAIQATAASFGVELRPIDLDRPGEIEHALTEFAGASNIGLIVTGSPRAS
jgi:putative tryptophan/tyrosine transport system substrate-binding protein